MARSLISHTARSGAPHPAESEWKFLRQGSAWSAKTFKKFTLQAGMRRTKSAWFAEKGYLAQAQNFFDAIRQGAPPQVTVRDGARGDHRLPAHAGFGEDAERLRDRP